MKNALESNPISATMPTHPLGAGVSRETAEADQLFLKVAWRLMPILMFLFIVSWIDRVNIGFAKLRMLQDLGFSETVYGLGAGIFFIGYFLFEIPSNLILQRIGTKKTLARITILWGVTSMAMLFVKSTTSFYILRFLLGAFEAGLNPGIVLYLTLWFPAFRRAQMIGLFISASAIAGIVGGPIAGKIMDSMGGVAGLTNWQWLFAIEGMPSVLIGIAVLFLLSDKPDQAKWLSSREKAIIQAEISADDVRAGLRQHSFLAALKTPKMWLFSLIFFCIVSGNMAIAFWAPTIIRDFGVGSGLQIGLLSAIPYITGAVCMVLNARHSDRKRERRFHCAAAAAIGAIALATMAAVPDHPVISMIALTIATGGILSAFPVFWEIPLTLLTGGAAAGIVALINSIGNLSGFAGPYLIGYLKTLTGHVASGLYIVAAFEVLAAVLILWSVPASRQ
jgi:D-galactonate transporter